MCKTCFQIRKQVLDDIYRTIEESQEEKEQQDADKPQSTSNSKMQSERARDAEDSSDDDIQ